MKHLMKVVLAALIMASLYSCAKEDVKYTKMPDNGNVNFNCGSNK